MHLHIYTALNKTVAQARSSGNRSFIYSLAERLRCRAAPPVALGRPWPWDARGRSRLLVTAAEALPADLLGPRRQGEACAFLGYQVRCGWSDAAVGMRLPLPALGGGGVSRGTAGSTLCSSSVPPATHDVRRLTADVSLHYTHTHAFTHVHMQTHTLLISRYEINNSDIKLFQDVHYIQPYQY